MGRITDGDRGHRVFTGNQPIANEYFSVIHAIEDTRLSYNNYAQALDSDLVKIYLGDTTVTDLDLKSGDKIFGVFTNISVASGKVLSYLI